MKILVIDKNGMLGHVVCLYFRENKHEVNSFDSLDTAKLAFEIKNGNYDAVINCSAIINQDAEEDKAKATFVNSYLPHFLEKVTKSSKTVVVHRSTDCIFSGECGHYGLKDIPDAQSFYAKSKALGELDNDKDITIRTSLIGAETNSCGKGLLNWYLKNTGEVDGYANAIWTGITTVEFARQAEVLLREQKHGIFQLVPNYAISKFDLLCLFEKYFPDNRKINKIFNKRVDKSLMQVLHNSSLTIPDYETMVREIKLWIDAHSELYPDYYIN